MLPQSLERVRVGLREPRQQVHKRESELLRTSSICTSSTACRCFSATMAAGDEKTSGWTTSFGGVAGPRIVEAPLVTRRLRILICPVVLDDDGMRRSSVKPEGLRGPDDFRTLSSPGARGPMPRSAKEATFLAGVGRGEASMGGRGRFEVAPVELVCESQLRSTRSG